MEISGVTAQGEQVENLGVSLAEQKKWGLAWDGYRYTEEKFVIRYGEQILFW